MNLIRFILLIFMTTAPSLTWAQVVNFEDAAALLGASCGKDIDNNCRGVNFDTGRLKDCLARNRDVVSPKCQTDAVRAFESIQQRIAARAAITKLCERDAAKFCGEAVNEGKPLQCLLTGPRGVSINCNKAISAGGYR